MSGSQPEAGSCAAGRVLHRGKWVLPMAFPPISDGGVLVSGDEILAVGPFKEIRKGCPARTAVREHPSAALLPGLVNAHTHLELSVFAGRMRLPQPDFPSWLSELLTLKAENHKDMGPEAWKAVRQDVFNSGTRLVGDVGNSLRLREKSDFPGNGDALPLSHVFYELLGFNRRNFDEGPQAREMNLFLRRAPRDEFLSLGAHAAYSTSPMLIKKAKDWCNRHGRPFSIHCSEHPEEMEFLLHGKGFCRRLLEELGRWDPAWEPPGVSPVKYLHGLGVLDEKTILVHAVHLGRDDRQLVARTGAKVCFCPRSNFNLNVGRPDPAAALAARITCGLGTDSLAGNEDLNLFSEAVFVLENFQGVPPRQLMEMITINGAAMLGKAQRAGSLQAGSTSAFLAVAIPPSTRLSQLMETVLYQGKKGAWQWARPPAID